MGAWSTDTFGNDAANDWAYALEGCDDLSLVESTLQEVLDQGEEDYIGSKLGSQALAACEVLARLQGNSGFHNIYTEKVDEWVKQHQQITATKELLQMAITVIDRVLTEPSSLINEWEGNEDWLNAVKDLRSRVELQS